MSKASRKRVFILSSREQYVEKHQHFKLKDFNQILLQGMYEGVIMKQNEFKLQAHHQIRNYKPQTAFFFFFPKTVKVEQSKKKTKQYFQNIHIYVDRASVAASN